MLYVWDGYDNATHIKETGYGLQLRRNEWNDQSVQARLVATSEHMCSRHGPTEAAGILNDFLD